MGRNKRYSSKSKVSFTAETLKVFVDKVGEGKQFGSKSECVNFAVVKAYGSEVQKAGQKRRTLLTELSKKMSKRADLEKKNPRALGRGAVLSLTYGVHLSEEVTLSEMAVADWDSVWNPRRKVARWVVTLKGSSPEVVRLRALLAKNGASERRGAAEYKEPSEILPDVMAASEMVELDAEITKLKIELKQLKNGTDSSQEDGGRCSF